MPGLGFLSKTGFGKISLSDLRNIKYEILRKFNTDDKTNLPNYRPVTKDCFFFNRASGPVCGPDSGCENFSDHDRAKKFCISSVS